MSKGDSFDMRLTELVERLSSEDLPALRDRRLRSLGDEQRARLDETMLALDGLLDLLDQREAAIASGSVHPVITPAADTTESPKTFQMSGSEEDADTEGPDTVVLEAVSDSDMDTSHIEPDALPQVQTNEEPIEDYVIPQVEEEEPPSPGWTRRSELLYDDMLRLFRLADSDGALVSLERLLTSTPLNADLTEFIHVNEERLLELYQSVIGPLDSVPTTLDTTEGPIPTAFLKFSKISSILPLIDGVNCIQDIMEAAPLSRLETITVINQLLRSGVITVEGTT